MCGATMVAVSVGPLQVAARSSGTIALQQRMTQSRNDSLLRYRGMELMIPMLLIIVLTAVSKVAVARRASVCLFVDSTSPVRLSAANRIRSIGDPLMPGHAFARGLSSAATPAQVHARVLPGDKRHAPGTRIAIVGVT
jgi:hypothetical protein